MRSRRATDLRDPGHECPRGQCRQADEKNARGDDDPDEPLPGGLLVARGGEVVATLLDGGLYCLPVAAGKLSSG